MRSDSGADQAEGLRRLLLRNHARVITLVAGKPGVGRTSATINLAAALASSGKGVIVLDENHAPDNLASRLGLRARHDLLDVLHGKCKPRTALLASGGFSVLPTARAISALTMLNHTEQQRLENALAEVSSGVDVMLVDAAMPSGRAAMTSSLVSGASLLVVMDATASGITGSYALIKRLALENARLQFEIIVNKAADQRAAMKVFGNMRQVARRNLAARLEYLGHIPFDSRLERAAQLGKPVLEAYPAADSSRSYLELARCLLRLPVHHEEPAVEIPSTMQIIVKHITRQHCGEMPLVVN